MKIIFATTILSMLSIIIAYPRGKESVFNILDEYNISGAEKENLDDYIKFECTLNTTKRSYPGLVFIEETIGGERWMTASMYEQYTGNNIGNIFHLPRYSQFKMYDVRYCGIRWVLFKQSCSDQTPHGFQM